MDLSILMVAKMNKICNNYIACCELKLVNALTNISEWGLVVNCYQKCDIFLVIITIN